MTARSRESVAGSVAQLLRRVAPFAISIAALSYVFGHVIDPRELPLSGSNANLPLFVGVVVVDKLVFFFGWSLIQWRIVQQFVEPMPLRNMMAIKGASELVRAVSPQLADAAMFLGLSQVLRDRLSGLIAVALVPTIAQLTVLLVQCTLALPFLDEGLDANSDVAWTVAIGWSIFVGIWILGRLGVTATLMRRGGLERLHSQLNFKSVRPYLIFFTLLMSFDVLVQGIASRAFGIDIAWSALIARIPVFYLVLTIPSFGNFGTRELAWSRLFSNYGSTEELVAFALWTNVIFLIMHVIIGAAFVQRAIGMVRELRRQSRAGSEDVNGLGRDRSESSSSPADR